MASSYFLAGDYEGDDIEYDRDKPGRHLSQSNSVPGVVVVDGVAVVADPVVFAGKTVLRPVLSVQTYPLFALGEPDRIDSGHYYPMLVEYYLSVMRAQVLTKRMWSDWRRLRMKKTTTTMMMTTSTMKRKELWLRMAL